MQEIPIASISENPYNSRLRYTDSEIRQLANSISKIGLLSPILVRPKEKEKFELVFGHRRFRAAKLLDWKTISADVRNLSDVEMIQVSLSENLVRSDLSDYEKALSFERMNAEFGLSQEEIGKLTGYSRPHICNYIRMLNLFDPLILEKDKTLKQKLHLVSEHHARIILKLGDSEDRRRAVELVATQGLSVQDLHRVIHRFRGWFESGHPPLEGEEVEVDSKNENGLKVGLQISDSRSEDVQEIQRILLQSASYLTPAISIHSQNCMTLKTAFRFTAASFLKIGRREQGNDYDQELVLQCSPPIKGENTRSSHTTLRKSCFGHFLRRLCK